MRMSKDSARAAVVLGLPYSHRNRSIARRRADANSKCRSNPDRNGGIGWKPLTPPPRPFARLTPGGATVSESMPPRQNSMRDCHEASGEFGRRSSISVSPLRSNPIRVSRAVLLVLTSSSSFACSAAVSHDGEVTETSDYSAALPKVYKQAMVTMTCRR